MDVASFADLADEFHARVSRIVWCTVTTVDARGRPRARILHPMWEGSTGYILTGRHSYKEKHLAGNPWVSLSYWDPQHQQVYAECKSAWVDDPAEKARIWKLFKETPEPYGYDPSLFWPKGPEDADTGVLKLTPWRVEVSSIFDMAAGKPPLVWKQQVR